MICSISCGLAVIFVIAMIFTNIAAYKDKVIQKYKSQLPKDLKEKYEKISQERLRIYYQGFLIGFIISLFIIFYNYQLKKNKLSTSSIVCIVIATSFIVTYFYYYLHPKSDWMLNNIKDQEQNKAWLKMYRQMQLYSHSGFLLGLIAIAILGFAFKCN